MSDISFATLTATQRIFYNCFPRLPRFIKRQKQISREFACGRCASIQSNASTGSSSHEQITAEDPRCDGETPYLVRLSTCFRPESLANSRV